MSNIPHTIGIIMDGNRRYAKERGLPTLEGHRAGLERVKEVALWAQEKGVKELILYTFSTENWRRSEEEVGYLMGLIEFAFDTWIEDLVRNGFRIRFIGERSRFSEKIQKLFQATEEKTASAEGTTLAFALSYGGRAEILAAARELAEKGKEITEETFASALWTRGLQDPDLIIRTGGDRRLSNFLIWQSAYSELFFIDTCWPAFSKEEFESVLNEFANRDRRYGA